MVESRLQDATNDKSRPAVIALCVLTLRVMENWRAIVAQLTGKPADTDDTMIVMAVVAIGAEKFTRGVLEAELHNLATAMPLGRLNQCNYRSIAAATGMNRETVRRKVLRLQGLGILENVEPDGIRVAPIFAAQEEVKATIRSQVDAITRATDRLRSLGYPAKRPR